MMYPSEIEDILKEKYHPQLMNLISLADSNQVPAICLTGNDEGLLNLLVRVFLSTYEEKKYNQIYNSNDFFEIESDSGSIKIDDIRKLIRFSSLKKEHLRHKYTVIKNIENATIYAQNSLLKVIEEPGIDTLFLCTSCSFAGLLNTIRSRLFRVNIPNKPLKDLNNIFCDEISWLANLSLDVLVDFSRLSKSMQGQFIQSIRAKSLTEMTEDYIKSCGEYELDFEGGITLQGVSLKRLYALLLVEKLLKEILEASDEVKLLIYDFKALITTKKLYKAPREKATTTTFNNTFFKELFSIAERMVYILLNFQEGNLLGPLGYTQLTRLSLKKKPKMKKNKIREYLSFLETIKNAKQISLNTELLMINFLIRTQRIFKESE